ncbi:MAG: cytochrome C [Phycisphaerales bacterium]|nr:cytochrome C [Phycisphaerales bacterium]
MTRQVWVGVLGFVIATGARADGPKDYSGNCTDAACHGNFAKLAVVHDPVGDEGCDLCHTAKEGTQHKFELNAKGAELCTDCHDEFSGKVVHSPVAEGDCTTCHDPHASAFPKLLREATVGAVCAECHDDVMDGQQFLHGPVAAGGCSGCHNPHASEHKGLLLAEGRDLCFKCHQPMKQRLADAKDVHSPAQEGCTDCHDAHGSAYRMLTRETGSALCFDCHDDISDAVEDAMVKHSAVTDGKGCAACHDAHASPDAHLLVAKEETICLSCHGEEIKTAKGVLPGFTKLLAENPTHHGPIDDGDCTICHLDVHGSARVALLGGAYPATMYTSFSDDAYALCFECHESEAFTEATTDDATEFRNGEQNLHALHVGKDIKGRTCRACHDVHASKGPHLLAESVPFGEWRIPIGFKGTETGGTCASGCHRPYRYDRDKAVVNLPKSPAATPET